MDQLYMLRAFVAAARYQSFSKAAESLNVTTGSVSKAIAKLEGCIQTRVLLRTTRSVSLTEAAQPYYQSCCRLLEELDEANRRITRSREVDSGKLRLIVHPMLMSETFSRLVRGYHAIAPNVNLIVSVQEGAANLYDGRFDMAILPPHLVEQSAVIRRTLSKSLRIFVAAPAYLEQYGTPKVAAELSRHFLLLDMDSRKKGVDVVELLENDTRVSVSPMSSMDGNEILLRAAALMGTGIAALPETMVREDIEAGRLTHILPLCTTFDSKVEICLFYSHRELLPARLRTFVDYCTQFFRSSARYDVKDAATVLPLNDYREDYSRRPAEARHARPSPFESVGR
ncbi:LysR family transcriptional regulator [Paraburkholderia sp. BL25I1N1]|uniref:LysR family transcriptional regulator n=1 Tax=Paraburkholderia sp. BL25I1N1 TaxID=1938804 RepID=UPI000D07A869|nr:LysR family transcriptional regulator [Paraburkholderia sp. BL25I1N1]PRY00200.1 DNA-binding transcriptional LysR family regulator [Paraburkholderia sp. BL25I1N1]